MNTKLRTNDDQEKWKTHTINSSKTIDKCIDKDRRQKPHMHMTWQGSQNEDGHSSKEIHLYDIKHIYFQDLLK